MSVDPMAQHQAEAEISRLSARLTSATNELVRVAREAAKAEVNFDRARARLWLELKDREGTIPEKEAEVLNKLGPLYEDHKVSKAELRIIVISCENLRAQLSALQSINANVRALVTGR
jgi:hypothetical protein